MAEVDPETLLEWLQSGAGEERDMQLIALEQLCMLLLMSDNVDRCFECCPPRTFLPALCRIFLDVAAPDQVNIDQSEVLILHVNQLEAFILKIDQ